MDHFHQLMELVDKHSSVIPEGDYLEMCNILKRIHEKVNQPSFLLETEVTVEYTPFVYEPTIPVAPGLTTLDAFVPRRIYRT
jgi:hypothetical protein